MKDVIKRYTKDDLEVVWQPSKCTHSAVCAKTLGDVFNPKKRPWINLDASDKESIENTVRSCPSGALSLPDAQAIPDSTQDRPDVTITLLENGPLLINGRTTITLSDGSQQAKTNPALCRCGASSNKPFCDGSHTKAGFKG